MQPIQRTAPMNGVAVAPVGLGFFSMILFWWYPFGLILSCFGLVIGVFCLCRGIRGGRRGENMALLGTIFCLISFTTIITLTQILHMATWDPL